MEKNSEIGIRLILSNSSKSKTYNTHLKNIKSSDMKIINTKIEIGEVVPGKKEIYIKTTTLGTDSDYTLVEVELCWQNPNGELCETKDLIEVLSQKKDVDWEQISRLQPYTLEQVEKEEDFVGRVNTFDQMYSRLTSTILESSIIWGQKRVGKTSIAKVLEEKIKKNANYSVVYVLIGEQDKRSVEKFLDTLYNSINSKLIKQLKLDYTRIDIPQNDGSLYPIFKYFDIIDEIKPGKRIVILDEFDELPPDLIRYNENSDTFYHNIRAISNRKNIGLIFVGGENIRQIIEASDRLNKFGNYRVDYFNKENNWEDFVDLVQRPAKGNIEFSPEAIEEIYYYTEGNPFYTKMICKDLYVKACKNKNSYIIALDVKKSVADLIDSENNLSDTLTLQHVNHFWKDGIIVDDQAKRDQIETMRRKFLLIFSDAKRNKDQITSSDLTTDNYLSSGIDIQSILESYQSRSIIIDDNGYLRFKPRLVEKWIIEVGMKQISTSFLDEEAVKFLKEKEAGLYVTDKEIILLIEKWENYKGSKIETGHIRFWLDQFKGNKEKRLMFTLLEHIKFYHESDVREKLRAINTKVGTFWHKKEIDEGYQRKRDDVIVSAFGSPAKSGASMCRKFINENNIYSDWAINAPEIKDILANDGKYKDVKTIIFIEDIIGTGRQICEGYRSFIEETHKILSSRDINVFIAAICGTENGKRNIENCIQEYSIEAGVYIIDSLIDSDKCFNENSSVFENDEDRRKSLSIAQEYGKKVDKKQPLGFEDSQLLITFFDTCPNNTLPIFWSLEKGWKPIFPKYG